MVTGCRDVRETGLVGIVGFGVEGFRDAFDLCERKVVDEVFDASAVERGESTDLLGPVTGRIRDDEDVAAGGMDLVANEEGVGAREEVERRALIIGGCRREAVGSAGIPETLETKGFRLTSLSAILARYLRLSVGAG
jgi:hypothetical protein